MDEDAVKITALPQEPKTSGKAVLKNSLYLGPKNPHDKVHTATLHAALPSTASAAAFISAPAGGVKVHGAVGLITAGGLKAVSLKSATAGIRKARGQTEQIKGGQNVRQLEVEYKNHQQIAILKPGSRPGSANDKAVGDVSAAACRSNSAAAPTAHRVLSAGLRTNTTLAPAARLGAGVEGNYTFSTAPRGVPTRPRPSSASATDSSEATLHDAAPACLTALLHVTEADTRTAKWMAVLQTMKASPNSPNFVYLRHALPATALRDPYDLIIVPHEKVKGQAEYFTMSGAGVTRFLGDDVEFLSLDAWEREHALHKLLTAMPVFRQFRLCKCWQLWRRAVSSRKVVGAKSALTQHLFLLNPTFRTAILSIRQACFDLTRSRLHALVPGEILDLAAFTNSHGEQLSRMESQLTAFSTTTLAVVQRACIVALQLMEDALIGQKTSERDEANGGAAGTNKIGAAQGVRAGVAALSKAVQAAGESEFSYAINAGRRSFKRRLHNLVRLLDYLGCSTLSSLLYLSLSDMLAAFTAAAPPDVTSDEERAAAAAAAAAAKAAAVAAAAEAAAAAAAPAIAVVNSEASIGTEGAVQAPPTTDSVFLTSLAAVTSGDGEAGNDDFKLECVVEDSGFMSVVAAAAGLAPPRPASSASTAATDGVAKSGLMAVHGTESAEAHLLAQGAGTISLSGEVPESQEDFLRVKEACTWGGPLLRLQVLMVEAEDGSSELVFSPSLEQFEEHVAAVLAHFSTIVSLVERLITHPQLQDYMEAPLDSEGVDLEGLAIMVYGPRHHTLAEEVVERLRGAFSVAEEYKATLLTCRDLVVANRAVTAESLRAEVAAGTRTLHTFRADIQRYRAQLQQVLHLPLTRDVGVLRLTLSELIATFRPSPERCLSLICNLLPELSATTYNAFITKVHVATRQLQRLPTSVEEFAAFLELLAAQEASRQALDKEYDEVVAHYELMSEFSIEVRPLQQAAFATLESDYQTLRDAIWGADSHTERLAQSFKAELDARVAAVGKKVAELRLAAQLDMVLDARTKSARAISYMQQLVAQVAELAATAAGVQQHQRLFKLEEAKFEELSDCTDDITLRHSLWSSKVSWAGLTTAWLAGRLDRTNLSDMEEAVQRYHKAVFRMERGLPFNKVVPQLRETVNLWRELLPVLQCLRQPSLRERHWSKINTVLGCHPDRADRLLLSDLLARKILVNKDALAAISMEASQEAALEGLLDKVGEKWKGLELAIAPYKEVKDTYVLGSVDDVAVVLEDSMVLLATILSSRFVSGIRPEVERLDRQLQLFSDTLDTWLEVQGRWMYLETIFGAADIQRQLPTEAKLFVQVDKQFKDVMRKAKDRPAAMVAGTQPGLLETLERCNGALEMVQSNLEDYLETKRVSFPRFYFLSNDELLDILSQARRPHAVQPHLQKCFDGIRQLEMGDSLVSADITAMISGEGERVGLSKNLKARGGVEMWLSQVEAAMRTSMRALAKKGMRDYASGVREEWVLAQPAQLAIVISNIYWCQAVEACLDSRDPISALDACYDANCTALGHLSGRVRAPLTPLERKVLVALLTIDVHNRDIVGELVAHKVCSRDDFTWQAQLRYEYGTGPAETDSDGVVVRQVRARFDYAFEYLGAQPRLVVTPMTDRCYLTLTGALHMHLGGAPTGPAGTGKTETIKDLGKALGVQCVVFNCGENLDKKFMGKFFSGLAAAGAWACFDEFNRIDIEVLSVVAQQLLAIQNAQRAGLHAFMFEGRSIRLLPTCGVFITMNPGYAGRTELPDNLQALFRPISMMVPDYALVAEVMLFAEGFADARNLARKMVALYKLASEQLSQQDHYDFGMRALKSVLVMAGTLARTAPPGLGEDTVLIRAMRDANTPKFLTADAVLFDAIVSDLFPGAALPEQDFGVLQSAVLQSCTAAGLQPVESFVTKVLQLDDTLNVRFGVMLVGPTGGGKTECYCTLQQAHNLLSSTTITTSDGQQAVAPPPTDCPYQLVHTHVLNPKSISLGELYGEYNRLNEWSDGLVSSLIRTAVASPPPDHHWIVLDGPVDAVWVENMNTVLDDNCMLCLPNGERIKLDPSGMRVLFEVQDLAVASPATVSRCGMVYMPSEDLGWRPYMRSWLARLPAAQTVPNAPCLAVSADACDFLATLFETHVPPLLACIRSRCHEALPSVDVALVASLAHILQALTHPSCGPDLSETTLDVATRNSLCYIFAFATVWGLGGNLDVGSWETFDGAVRDEFEGAANFPGGSSTVFDYRLDPDRNYSLVLWEHSVPKYSHNPDMPYFQILVPTVDTTRYSYLVKLLVGSQQRSVLLSGAGGVGKSAVMMQVLEAMQTSDSVLPVVMNFSAQTSSLATQALVESKLEKKRKRRYAAPAGRRIVLFVDDVNMPAREHVGGAQPPIELLRQFQDRRGFYDRKKLFWKEVEDTVLCAACSLPGGGRQEVSARFLRHFALLCLPPPSESCMRTIFGSILAGFFEAHFSPDVSARLLKPLVVASVEVYARLCAELLPTPMKSHYCFNLRDVSKVFQGILTLRAGQAPDPRATFARLWCHEHMRVYHDRFICEEDQLYFKRMLHGLLRNRFDVREEYDDMFVKRRILFGDYMHMGAAREDRVYEEITGLEVMGTVLQRYLDEYNATSSTPLHLVLFADALEHISRIARILRQPRGNALLVGVGGSGKQSLARFACFITETTVSTVDRTRNYGVEEFRDALKKMYRLAGCDGKHIAFLLTDSHLADEACLEDVCGLLNSGDVNGLFAVDERERVFGEIRAWATARGIPDTKDALWAAFIGRVRDNLHLLLAMSPVGEVFRARCRAFPSLTACCTIDWYSEWPAVALLSVSTHLLSKEELGGVSINRTVADLCVELHTSVTAAADNFYAQLRRRYYVTPSSYLDLIFLYSTLLAERRQHMALARDRLLNGLHKLQETNSVVDSMQRELSDLQPILAEKTVATQQLLVEVSQEQSAAEAIQAVVAQEEQDVKKRQLEVQALKNEAQAELEAVLPALEGAETALAALNKADIIEIRTFVKPPALVQLSLEGVCILLQEKPDWDTAKRLLGESTFIKKLMEYDRDNIPEKVSRALKRLIDDPTFTPDQVAKQSKAAQSMCLWVHAMDTYAKVIRVVEPKRAVLHEAAEALDAMNIALADKQAQLVAVESAVRELKANLAATEDDLRNLQHQADLSQKRLGRAAQLIGALGEESVRWKTTAADLGDAMHQLVGDVFLCAAAISYMGAFTGKFRDELLGSWMARCKALGVPVSPSFSLAATLATPVLIREWTMAGLPTDALSVDNAILVCRGSRWPLMIDPQDQANRWVKAMESKHGLRVLRTTDPALMRGLEGCIRSGNPALLEDVGEALDPALEPLLGRQTFTQGQKTLLRLGDVDVEYDPRFRFYMTTKLPNPHYLPETCIKVNIINFTVTTQGLEDQLLGHVVRKERPELEEARERLLLSISSDKAALGELEDAILRLLRDSSGNILDDELLINTLNNAKAKSGITTSRVREAEETEKEINAAREVYRPVPQRGSVLYFVIADLALVDPMYQYSLAYFTKLFKACIDAAPKAHDLAGRLSAMLNHTTEVMYSMVCRGLFERHRAILSFLICTSIQRQDRRISPLEWDFLLRGGRSANASASTPARPPAVAWLAENVWAQVLALQSALPAVFGRLADSLTDQAAAWRAFAEAPCPDSTDTASQAASLAADSSSSAATLSSMQVLLLVKVFAEDKLLAAMQRYVATHLGSRFTESPSYSLPDIYADSAPATPVIFILSQGADPASSLIRLGESHNRKVGHRLRIISLGQGQGPVAESALNLAIKNGDWLCLQNCHLARSWMPRLERLMEELQERYRNQIEQQQEGELSYSPDGGDPAATASGPGSHPTSRSSSPAAGNARGASRFLEASRSSQTRSPTPPHAGARSSSTDRSASPSRLNTPNPSNPRSRSPSRPSPVRLSMGGRSSSTAPQADLDVHPDFRLWLTSRPSSYFPVPVLQHGIKVTMEPPKGVRANLLRTYGALSEEMLEGREWGPSPEQQTTWKRLVFACAFFHAVVQERRKYGALGWNVRYEFSPTDLSCSLATLRMFVSGSATSTLSTSTSSASLGPTSELLPWTALTYITGTINYGGRVTDDNDRRTLMAVLQRCYCPDVLKDGAPLTPDNSYCQPPEGDVASYLAHIRTMPATDGPAVFGLPSNADLTFQRQEARALLETVVALQPRMDGGSSGSSSSSGGNVHDDAIMRIAKEVEAALPPPLVPANACVARNPFAPLPSGHTNSLGTVLLQECGRFNTLLAVCSRSLAEVGRAVQGLAIMSGEAEECAAALLNNQVPATWAAEAYPSLKPLAGWVADLRARVQFMSSWLYEGQPAMFWLPGFTFPQGFLTAVIQNHARMTRLPIDHLAFAFHVLREEDAQERVASARSEARSEKSSCGGASQVGVLVQGLFLESACWDTAAGTLQGPRPGEMFSRLPPIHFCPGLSGVHLQTGGSGSVGGSRAGSRLTSATAASSHAAAAATATAIAAADGTGVSDAASAAADTNSPVSTTAAAVALAAAESAATVVASAESSGVYVCPLYKTSVRAGQLSTTGQSTNYVLSLVLPIPKGTTPSTWVLGGVAALCALDE